MAEMMHGTRGELLCAAEEITGSTGEVKEVRYSCAQNRVAGSPERGTYMPSESDLARAIEKISRLSDVQLTWFIRQMQHLGFSPYGRTSLDPGRQSR